MQTGRGKGRYTLNGADSIGWKTIVIFDLDGTLTKSKSNIDKEMTALIFFPFFHCGITCSCALFLA
jgi:hypothetical protein